MDQRAVHEAEIAHLRERLEFYESFDRLIQENVSRAGQLLREAAATGDSERRRLFAQAEYRTLLAGLLDEVSAVQGQVERLARRVADALDEVEAQLPPGSAAAERFPAPEPAAAALPPISTAPAAAAAERLEAASFDGDVVAAPDPEPTVDAPPTLIEDLPPLERDDGAADAGAGIAATFADTAPPEAPPADPATYEREASGEADLVEPVTPAGPQRTVRSSSTDEVPMPAAMNQPPPAVETPLPAADLAAASAGGGGSAATVVLVHGVPRATMALSLKRYLEGLTHIGTVEPREYAEGVLRLQVTGVRPLHFDDLRGWAEAAGLEPVHLRDDLVEVRMGK